MTCPGPDILIHRKVDGNKTFDRTWDEFKVGFGDPDEGHYWIGNDRLHYHTFYAGYTRLRVDMIGIDRYDNSLV